MRAERMLKTLPPGPNAAQRSYHFASSRFAQALQGVPKYDGTTLRKETVKTSPPLIGNS
jgi:hypothetical protein